MIAKTLSLVVLTLTALVVAACGGDDPKETPAALAEKAEAVTDDQLKEVTLRVGVQKDGIRAVLDRSGQLDGIPYKVEFSTFQFGPPLVEAAGADKIDLAWVGNTPPIFGAAAGSNFKVIAAVKERDSQENSIVLPKGSPIKSVEELKGKKIAVAKGSSAQGLLLNALKDAGLSLGDIEPVYLAPADGLAAFQADQVDAWVVWNPFSIQAFEEQGATELVGGEPYEGGFGFEIASATALEDPVKRAAINDYVNRLSGAWEWAGDNLDAWAEGWAADTGLPLAVMKKAAAAKASDIVPLDAEVLDRQQQLADLLSSEKVLPEAVDFESIIDTTAITLEK